MSIRKHHQPLYLRAAARLRRKVTKLEPGKRLPAESRLAKEFDVSIATIREAIRLLVAEGLVEPQQGRGTIVLPRTAPPVALLLNPDILDPRLSRFYLFAMRECRRLLEASGQPVRCYHGRATAEHPADPIHCPEFFDDLSSGKLRGVIALGTFPEPRLLKAIAHLPSAGMYRGFPRRTRGNVEQFLDLAIGQAIASGRRKIAMLAWNSPSDPSFCNFAQFRAAMERHHLVARPEWHRADLHPNLSGAGWDTFREVWSASREKPDALIISDDCLLPDAARAIAAVGLRVPDDLRVISHTVTEAPFATPFPVDRICVSAHQAARNLVQLLSVPVTESAVLGGRYLLAPAETPHALPLAL